MSAMDSAGQERLSRVVAVRRRQFATRVVVAAVVAGLFFGFTGWLFASLWFAVYLSLQVAEQHLLRKDDGGSGMRISSQALILAVLALDTLVLNSFGLCEALRGGVWGAVCACLLWAGSITYSVAVSNGSKPAFLAQALPSAIFYLTVPVITTAAGAPWIDAGAVIMAGGLNVMTGVAVWSAAQKLFEAEHAARAELERKKLEAEAATAAKSAFVAMVSHELRTPISAIMAGAGEIERNGGDAAVRSNGLLIADAARMMRTLLNDLLDLSKIEAGRMSVETIPYDLRGLVLDTVRFWSKAITKKTVRLRVVGAARVPRWALGDPTRLRQILNNLLSNASKFTRDGSITLSLEVLGGTETGFTLKATVRDTGPGMTAEQLGRLFQAFEQLGAATARTHGGTGLGLAISRDLAQLMGGELTAESAPGEGAAFTLTLPLLRAQGAAGGAQAAPPGSAVSRALEAEEPQAGALETATLETGAPLRVLVVDDNDFNRRAFSLMLSAVGAEVTTAEDGHKALEVLAAASFEVVLMDVNMPGLGGLEATRRLRAAQGPNAEVAVIALTAASGPDEIAACRRAGMSAFVSKPVASAELFQAIEQVLDGGEAFEPLAASA